jgi:hypothetical protein
VRGLAGIIATAVVLVVAAAAHAESIVYVSDGDLWLTNIERSIQLTNDGGYESPSQDNAGRIVAVRRVEEGEYTNRYIHRFDASGNQLNPRVTAVDVNNSLKIGPLGAEVSADGTFVAYHHFNRSPSIPDNQRPRFSISYASRDTPPEEIVTAGYYLNPTWIDNDRVAIFVDPDFSTEVQIYTLSGGGSFSDWFEFEPGALTSGDLAQTGTRFAAVADGGARLVFFSLEAPPPAPPTPRCEASTPNGQYGSVTWSPDGSAVAWAEGDGIHLAAVGDLAACDIREVALIPGGEAPFWGNATLPAEPVVCEVRIPKQVTRRKALRAIKVPIDCPGAAKATGKARASGEVVAKGSKSLSDEGAGKLAIKPTSDGKPLLREANKVRVKVNAGGERFAQKVKIGG